MHHARWNWQNPDWPNFVWNPEKLARAEQMFLTEAGVASGASLHLAVDDEKNLTVALMTGDAVDTAKIEGETLDRDSVQSSIRRGLGLATDKKRPRPAEAGIAQMTVDNFRTHADPLKHRSLHAWHALIAADRTDLENVGRYRDHPEPMRVVSGAGRKRRVHFEAPPSAMVRGEMTRFVRWFNRTLPSAGKKTLPTLTRAGIAHLWFESVHPYEDGNGRIGRAIAEKAIMQGLASPTVTALSTTLLKRRKEYYQTLEKASAGLEISDWLLWFSAVAIESARHCLSQVEFLIAKAKLFDSLRGRVNPRQEKVLARLFAAGPDGFAGGLSARNYAALTGAAPATITRDLADLVAKDALTRTGEKKATRYQLNIRVKPPTKVAIRDIV